MIGPVENHNGWAQTLNHVGQPQEEALPEDRVFPSAIVRDCNNRGLLNSCEAVLIVSRVGPTNVGDNSEAVIREDLSDRAIQPR